MSNAERIAKLIAEGRIEGALKQADIGEVNLLLKTGISFYQKGQYDIAEKIFDRVTQLDPKNGMAWYHKGNAFYGLKRYKGAIKCFDKSLEINPNDADAWYNKGLVHGRTKKKRRHERAIECFDKVLKINPKYANAWYNKGIALYHLKRHIEAIGCYNKALELNQEHVEAWYNKGVALDHVERHEEAIECFDKALEINPKDANVWYNEGVALDHVERHEEAIECFDKALEINPKDANVWYNKGVTLENLEKYEEAIKCFSAALEIKSDISDKVLQNLLSLLDKKLGTYEKLEERYEITKALDPKILRLLLKNWYNKGVALDHVERHEEAIECFDKALEINPKDAKVWYNKGVALDHVERHEEAIECFDKALEINPKDANVWYNKGVTLENLEKYEEAIKCFSAALEIKPNINNKVLQNLLSLLDKKLGTYEKLEERYEITKALDPKILRLLLKKRFSALENTPLEKIQEIARKSPRNIISRMNLITKLSLLGKHNEAVDSARKLVSEIPKSKFSHLQLGLSYIQNRRMLNPFKRYSLINDAEKEFNNAIEIDPNFALAHLDLALLYSYAGHEGKAKKEFEKAFNLEPQYVQAYRNFLDKSDEKYEGKYDHKDIISKIIQVIKTTGKIAFIGAVGTGLALGGVVSGTTDNITPLGDDLTSIQASSAYILDQETLPISLLDHSLNEGDMIEKSNIKTPFTPPPKNSNGVYLPVSISFKQGKSKQNSEIINESISKAGEQYILNKKQEETFMIQRDTHENENNKEIFDLPLFPPPSSTLEREDKGLKDAFDRLDSAAITAIISYLFYRKNKKDQQKRDDEMDRKIKELKTDRSYLEGKYELAKLYETLARIHQRLGNNRAAMGNIDHATTLYLEISNMDLGLKYRTPEPNKDFAKEVLQEKRIE